MKNERATDGKVRAFFEGLSDRHRMRIAGLLLEKDMNVSEICRHFKTEKRG